MAKKIKMLVQTRIEKRTHVTVPVDALRKALKTIIPDMMDDASIEFPVPSGGDYSGQLLDVETLLVGWIETEEETY